MFQEGNEVDREVPSEPVRHYFIGPSRALPAVASVIRHLLALDVEVHRLTAPLRVPNLKEYGRAPEPGRVAKGSFWIPLAQPQKRWIQAMLGEDPYVPFPYFYDVTAWSLPLLSNLDASFTGDRLSPRSMPVRAAPRGRVTAPGARPRFFWFDGESTQSVAAALSLAAEGVRVERLTHATRTGGEEIPQAAFIAARLEGIDLDLPAIAERYGIRMHGSTATRPGGPAVEVPKVAVYTPPGLAEVPAASLIGESLGHMRFFLERELDLPIDLLTGPQVAAGGLTLGEYDVFIVPGVPTVDLIVAREQIRLWIDAGGTYIGTGRPGATGGTPFAVSSGFTSATLSAAEAMQVPGTMFRVALDASSPLTLGAGDTAYWYHLGEDVLAHSTTGRNPAVFPKRKPDFWFSGYASGVGPLKGSAGLIEESLGSGRVILFSGEPNFRAYTDGMKFLFANALAYPEELAGPEIDVGSPAVAGWVEAARSSVPLAMGPGRPIRIEVKVEDVPPALAVLHRFTDRISIERVRGSGFLEIANPHGFAVDAHPYAYRILPALREAGVGVLSAIL